VTGSLDDPQFRLAPIIWKVFVNILVKAVTAPFALLGSLFGGGPDIQFIEFQPGVSTLDAPATEKAKSVAKALIERPQLKIEVPIAAAPDLDRPALVAAQFNAEVSAAQTSKGNPKQSTSATGGQPSFDQLDPATQLELLTRLYVKDIGAEPKFPDAVTNLKSKPEITAAKIDFLGKAVREHIHVGDNELTALGQQRALALQKHCWRIRRWPRNASSWRRTARQQPRMAWCDWNCRFNERAVEGARYVVVWVCYL